jgi:hypothetical protein
VHLKVKIGFLVGVGRINLAIEYQIMLFVLFYCVWGDDQVFDFIPTVVFSSHHICCMVQTMILSS